MGTKGENENQGLVSASKQQAKKDWQKKKKKKKKSLAGLCPSFVSLTRLDATMEGASYF